MISFPRVLPVIVLFATTTAAETVRLDAEIAARLAVEASPLANAAEARIDASRASVTAADAARMPLVTAGVKVGRRSSVPELAVALGGPEQPVQTLFPSIETTCRSDLTVTQPVYAGGAITAGRQAAGHELDAAEWSRGLTHMNLRFGARTGYWRAVTAEAGLKAARARERRAVRLVEDATALRAAGMAVDADVLAAEAQSAAARVDVIRSEAGVRDARARLRSLLGLAPGVEMVLADEVCLTAPREPMPLATLLTRARDERPELRVAEAGIAALAARERAVDAGRRPSLALSGQWELARPNNRFLPLEDRWNDSWSVGVTARWTVFNGDLTRAAAAVIRAERDAAAAERAEVTRHVAVEVETARLELAWALDAVQAADASLAAAAARERASRERYEAGLAAISERLDAEADLAAAEVAQIQTRAQAWVAAASLERAVGR